MKKTQDEDITFVAVLKFATQAYIQGHFEQTDCCSAGVECQVAQNAGRRI